MKKDLPNKIEKTSIKSLGLVGLLGGGSPCAVDVKDGKILRGRPLHYDWHYKKADFNPWKLERNGKTLEPLMKTLVGPFSLAYKKRTYSPNRIQYPLVRVDWDPKGERHPENRGKSKFKRISWDQAAQMVADEIQRINKAYGPLAILLQADGHGECKTVHTPHGQPRLLLEKTGGYTQQVRNPDSWEGWYWGSKHVWGQGAVGMMRPADNIVKDITEHTDMLVCWGCDVETTAWGFVGQFASRLLYFWSSVGIKQVYICPDVNYSVAIHADKWIPILPNTDAALQLAIIYTWIKEETYDKEYVRTHTVGFDKVTDYVLGKEDGIPKTPEWASKKCGVPEWTIKALARDWAKKVTSIGHYFGGSMVRGPYSHEPARLECILLGMQGLGKPGVHQCAITYQGMPRSAGVEERRFVTNTFSERLKKTVSYTFYPLSKQMIPKTLIAKAIQTGSVTFMGTGAIESPVAEQFQKYIYPIPEEEGGTEVHMIWTDTPCLTTCWNRGNETTEGYRSPKIECIVAQHPWLENDTLFADIILPSNTTMEVEDVVTNIRHGTQFSSVAFQKKAIEPVGESKSDYEVVLEIARKLGKLDEVTEGRSLEDLEKLAYDTWELNRFVSWQDLKEKQYYVFPIAKDWEKDPAGFYNFYKDPVKYPLPTPTGKLEFYSESLAKHFPTDTERPPIPKWIENSPMHDERLGGYRAQTYPLLAMSNHGRWRMHAQCDDIPWTREALTGKVKGWDGYLYEPVWIHPSDAVKRGISNGDMVQVFNERGIVLGGALVWERIMPGVISMDHGARVDFIEPGKIDRGGAIDLISPEGLVSRNCAGEATSGFLVDVQKVSRKQMQNWKKHFPETFNREYDPACGLLFDAWIEKSMPLLVNTEFSALNLLL